MARWTRDELRVLERLASPPAIQEFLDGLPYAAETGARSPRVTLRRRTAQCFGGAVFAAAALRRLGHPPRLVDLRAQNDDDHVLAVFERRGRWGAIGKSNFTTLRYREPVYRTLRELVMSYFDLYFNAIGEKSLREYSVTLDLRKYDRFDWTFAEGPLEEIERDIETIRHYRLLTPAMERELAPVGEALLEAGLLGSRADGLYRPHE